MTHSHDHAHSPAGAGRALARALVLTLAFAGVEAFAGWQARSLALLSDAGHMASDAAALGLALLAAWLARRPPSARHSYGLGRAEVLAALLNALAMLLVVVGIGQAAWARLHAPVPVAGPVVMAVAALGLAVNLLVASWLRQGEQTLNTRAALLHVLGDLLASVAALAAGAVIWLTGWTAADPLSSLLVCVLILISALRLLREALHVFMEGVPPHLDLAEVGQTMAGVAGVRSIHDLHIWTLSSGVIALSAHVVIDDLAQWDQRLNRLNTLLAERWRITHTTLQPERLPEIAVPLPRLRPLAD